MVGCFEIIEYIFYVADACISLGHLISRTTGMDSKFEPVIWASFYVSSVSIYCIGGAVFWRVSNTLCFFSLMILVIYCLGSAAFADFKFTKYVNYDVDSIQISYDGTTSYNNGTTSYNNKTIEAASNSLFSGGIVTFMKVLPLAGWFFIGIESLNFASNDIIEVRKSHNFKLIII